MTPQDCASHWNATTPEERFATYPSDRYLDVPFDGFVRGLDVEAPSEVTFQWLYQLEVARYSYDWIDDRGRRSPRELTSGAERQERGQHFLVFGVMDFAPNQHIYTLIPEGRPIKLASATLHLQRMDNGPDRMPEDAAVTYETERVTKGRSG
jgi:hypothetical protein